MEPVLFFLVITALRKVTGNVIYSYRFKVYPVDRCPLNSTEFEAAARRRNCTGNSRYLCAPDKNLTNLIEFCTDVPKSLYGKDNCVRLEGTGDLNHYNCLERFITGCPHTSYTDDNIYENTKLNFTAYAEENDEGYTSLKRIIQACEEGNLKNFLYHLKEIGQRKNLLCRTDKDGWNALHFAAKGGNLDIFRKLTLEKEFCKTTHDQMNVLHIASKFGRYKICEYILENEDFEEFLHAKSVQGKNACHYAAEGGYVNIFQLLAKKGVDAISKTNDGQNVFHVACIHNKLDMCHFISNHYHYLMFEECTGKWNALLYAAKNGNTSILEFLQTKDIDFRHTSESNRNALHIACDHGYLSACEKIIEACPSLLDTVDHKGRHAGHFAVRSGNVDVLKYLYSQRADLRKETTTGMNILHMACLHSYSKMCMYILEKYPEMNSKKTARGWTTMHFVAAKGNSKGSEIEIFEMLLHATCKVNIFALTDNHNSVLTLAVNTNDYKLVEYLLKYHSKLLKIQEATPLWALKNENPNMLHILDKYAKESGSK